MLKARLALLCVFALLVSLSSWQTVQASGLSALRGKGAMKEAIGKKVNSLSRYAVAALLSSSLIIGGGAIDADAHGVDKGKKHELIQQVRAQEEQESLNIRHSSSMSGMTWTERLANQDAEDNEVAWSQEVDKGNGVFYLALRNPDYDHIHHVVYVGDTATGEPMFAGIYLVGHEEDYIKLYASDGLVAQGFMQRDVVVFPDPLWGYDVTVFTIKDLSIAGRYTPVSLDTFPTHEVGKELEMVQFGINPDNPETLDDLPIRQRSCEVLAPNVWGQIPGYGRHSCTPLEKSKGQFGAPIFDPATGNFVGFYSEETPVGANLSEGMSEEFIQFVMDQQANPTAVSVKDKLTSTWGAIKSER